MTMKARMADLETKTSGWTSEYSSVQRILNYLARKTKSEASKRLMLDIIYNIMRFSGKNPDELVEMEKDEVEDLVHNYLDGLEKRGVSRSRVRTERTFIILFFRENGYKHAKELEITHYSLSARVRFKPQYVPTMEEAIKMADAAPNLKAGAAILCLATSGLRNATLRALTYGDVKAELEEGKETVFVPVYPEMKKRVPNACKNNIPYYTFFAPVAVRRLKSYLEQRRERQDGIIEDNEILFCTDDKKVKDRRYSPLTKNYLTRILKQSARNAGITQWNDIDAHSLRKTFEEVLDKPLIDGMRLDIKVREFLMGHILTGSQDPYFGSGVKVQGSAISFNKIKVEEMRKDYSKLTFEPKPVFKKEEAVLEAIRKFAEAFGIDPMRIKIEKQKELGKELNADEEIELIQNEIKKMREGERDPQRIVKEEELEKYLSDGWHFVSVLPSQRILIRR